jgi:hypothetical protein
MKNFVFGDIKTLFVPHRRLITSPLQTPAGLSYIRFEAFAAVTDECRLQGCDDPWLLLKPTFQVERITSIIRVKRISELGTLAGTSN